MRLPFIPHSCNLFEIRPTCCMRLVQETDEDGRLVMEDVEPISMASGANMGRCGNLRPPAVVTEFMSQGSVKQALARKSDVVSGNMHRVVVAMDAAKVRSVLLPYVHGKRLRCQSFFFRVDFCCYSVPAHMDRGALTLDVLDALIFNFKELDRSGGANTGLALPYGLTGRCKCQSALDAKLRGLQYQQVRHVC